MIKHIENYLLDTGRCRVFLKYYFLIRYWVPVHLLMHYYSLWTVIDEGFHPHDTFRVFLKTYNWRFEYYNRVTRICFYLQKIEVVPIQSCMMQRYFSATGFIRKRKPKITFLTIIIDRLTHIGKEVAHA